MKVTYRMQEVELFSIPLLWSAFRLIHPFRGFTGNRRVSHPVMGRLLAFGRSPAGTAPRHLGLFPPFGRASIDRRQRLRFGLRSSGTALHFLPFRHSVPRSRGFHRALTPGIPGAFPQCGRSEQLPLPKADASQNGFHPAYALSCKMAWRNSFFLCGCQGALERPFACSGSAAGSAFPLSLPTRIE